MRYLLVLFVCTCFCGCSDRDSTIVADRISKIDEGIRKSEENEAKVRDSIKLDKEAILFPAAKAKVLKGAKESIGTKNAEQATITPDAIKDFGDSKWEVSGAYSGPDRNGKKFSSRWTATFDISFGGLQCLHTDLGTMTYDP